VTDAAVRPEVTGVFLHVTDLGRAVAWWSELLGLPASPTTHGGLIADLRGPSGPPVILDGHRHARGLPAPDAGPLFMLATDDAAAARARVLALGGEAGDVEDIGSLLVVHVADLDGNRVVLGQAKG
jgi:hypothetical protein